MTKKCLLSKEYTPLCEYFKFLIEEYLPLCELTKMVFLHLKILST